MNPAQIEALIADLTSRSTDAVNRGNQDAADIYEVSARVVRDHAELAANYGRDPAERAARMAAASLTGSARVPL